MNSSKVAIVMSTIFGKLRSILGYIIVIGLVISLLGRSGKSDIPLSTDIFMYVITFSLGFFLIISGAKTKHRVLRFRKYVGLISVRQMTSIDDIAAATSQSVDFVKKDLQKMINKKYFPNAFINDGARRIVISRNEQYNQNLAQPISQNVQVNQNESESVKCPGCGAMALRLKGAPVNCEYCGTQIN